MTSIQNLESVILGSLRHVSVLNPQTPKTLDWRKVSRQGIGMGFRAVRPRWPSSSFGIRGACSETKVGAVCMLEAEIGIHSTALACLG